MSDVLAPGRLEDHPFAALAGFIFREGRSGELTLESGNRRRRVWFLGGNPVAVLSDDPADHVARFLLDQGKISAEAAARLAALPETRAAVGTEPSVPKDVLNWGVKYRFVNLCYDLFRWEEGDYRFREDTPPRELFLLKVPAHALLFKGIGYLPKATLVDRVPQDAVIVPGPVTPAEARYLGPEERRFLDECRPGRTVAEVLGGGWGDPDQARRLLYGFSCAGLVAFTPAPEAPAPPAPPPEEPVLALDETEEFPGAAVPEPPEEVPAEPAAHEPYVPPDFETPSEPTYPYLPLDESPPLDGPSEGSGAEDLREPLPLRGSSAAAPRRTPSPAAPRRLPRMARSASLLLLSVLAVAAIGAGVWWWMGSAEEPLPAVIPPLRNPRTAPPAPTLSPQPAPQPSPTPPPVPTALPASPSPAAAPPRAGAAQEPIAEPVPLPGRSVSQRYRNGLDVMNAGDLDGAAAIWESLLAEEHRGEFTLQVMTACERETVRAAFRRLSAQGPVYLVNKQVQGRACFRVCFGVFPTRDAAGRALTTVPTEFRAAGAATRAVADVLDASR